MHKLRPALFFTVILSASTCFGQVPESPNILWSCDFADGDNAYAALQACGSNVSSSTPLSLIEAGGPNGIPAITLQHTSAPSDYTAAIFEADHDPHGPDGITYVYWERFSKWPIESANTKSSRPYIGGSGYMGAMMSAWFSTFIYMSSWDSGELVPTERVRSVLTESAYCPPSGNGTYNCNAGRLAIRWSVDGGATDGFGTHWRKVRLHIRPPSTSSAGDGLIRLWVDEKEIFSVINIKASEAGGRRHRVMRWYPSDDAAVAFAHSYADLVIYDGYVPPSGESMPPNPPVDLLVQ